MEQRISPADTSFDAPLRVGLLGCGTVGSEVARTLRERVPPGLVLERVAVRDLGKNRPVKLPSSHLTDDPLTIVKDPAIDIVVEVIGGIDPALGLLRQALAEHKHVVTANKSLLANHALISPARCRSSAPVRAAGPRRQQSSQTSKRSHAPTPRRGWPSRSPQKGEPSHDDDADRPCLRARRAGSRM